MEIILKSLLAAFITAIILLISKFVGPKLAGAIGGIPVVFAISYGLIIANMKKADNEFISGGIYGSIASIFFSIILIFMNNKFNQIPWVNFGVAYLLCFLFMLLLVSISPNKNS
jgi:hypothetical protein